MHIVVENPRVRNYSEALALMVDIPLLRADDLQQGLSYSRTLERSAMVEIITNFHAFSMKWPSQKVLVIQ